MSIGKFQSRDNLQLSNKQMPKNKLIKFSIKAVGSMVFLWWVIFRVNWEEVWSYLQKITFWQIALYIVAYIGGMLFSSYKWQRLSAHKDIKLSFWEFFRSYYAATFINNFMPSFVGGDSFKVYKIGAVNKNYKEAASSVIMDRLTGLWGAMILAVLFAALNFGNIVKNDILLYINEAILVGLIVWFLLLEIFRNRDIKTPFKKVNKLFNMIVNEVNRYNGKSNELWRAVLLSFAFNFVGLAGANYILFWSMGIQIGILNYLSVIFLISIISSVPVTINNIGIKEWAYITFFGFFGANPAAVLSVAILSRIIQMLLSFFALPIYLTEKRRNNSND